MSIERDDDLAIRLEKYAIDNPAPLLQIGASAEATIFGWPIHELVKKLPPSERQRAFSALVKRHGGPPVMNAVPVGVIGGLTGGLSRGAVTTQTLHSLEEQMAARMRWGKIGGPWAVGFSHMAMHQAGDMVHVWIITKDSKSVVLEDDVSLYPSDALITKIRLLQKE